MKWIVAVAVVVVVLVVALLAAVPYLVDTARVQGLIAGTASQALGRPVKFRSVKVRVLPLPAIELRGLEVADDPAFGRDPFLTLDTGLVRLRIRPLLTGRVELGDVVLDQPLVTVVQNAQGQWNVASLGGGPDARPAGGRPPRGNGGAAGAGAVLGAKVKIERGVVTYLTRGAGKAATSQYRVEGLDLTVTPRGGQLAFDGAARVQPGDLAVKIAEGVVAFNGTRSVSDAPVRAQVRLDARDVSPLAAAAAGPSVELAGSLKAGLAVGGTVGAPTATGEVELSRPSVTQTNAQCPDPKRRTLELAPIKLNAAWQGGRFAGRAVTTGIGAGTIHANVVATLDRGVRVQLNDLALKSVPLDKVLVDYLCQGYAVTGPLDLTGSLVFGLADLLGTLDGPGQLRIGPGKVVGPQALALVGNLVRVGGAVSSLLAADLPASLASSPLEFDSITATYQITNGVVTTRDFVYTSRAMKVAAAGDYALPTGRMNLNLVVNHGRGEVRARVTGTAASPSIRVDPASVLRNVEPGKVERGLQDLLRRFR